jgi:hypothetical protein
VHEELKFVNIHYVTIGPSGDDGPTIRVKYRGLAESAVQGQINTAVNLNGVWDLEAKIFHPWHSVLRVRWSESDVTAEDRDLEAYKQAEAQQKARDERMNSDPLNRSEY